MILIIAARSFVGIELARQLAALSYPLRVVVADTDEARLFDDFQGVEVVRAHSDTLAPPDALDDIDKAFVATPTSPAEAGMQRKFMRAARAAGVRRLVRLNGVAVAPDSLTPSTAAHAARARFSGPPFSCMSVRAGISYQALTVRLLHFSGAARLRQILSDEREIAPVDARDVAAVAITALTASGHEGQHHCVNGPETLTLVEIADKLSFATGCKLSEAEQSSCQPAQTSKWTGWEASVAADLLGGRAVIEIKPGATLRRITGREPIAFDEFAAEITTRCPMFKRSRDWPDRFIGLFAVTNDLFIARK